jgi:dTDP-4-dehydrorhamnose reductase
MTEKPFVHKKAFNDVEMNFMYHEDLAKNLLKLINHKGIINVGGSKKIVYDFAKQTNKKIISMSARKILGKSFPRKQTMNLKRYNKIIKK